ncbi:hypothetical protein BV20DRAFT_968392, partial [Pilatotrama ljubarskyi]
MSRTCIKKFLKDLVESILVVFASLASPCIRVYAASYVSPRMDYDGSAKGLQR